MSPELWTDIGIAALSQGTNIISTAMTNNANERMQQQQNKWNLEQWNRNNAYNHPAAQMQRLKAAGLNPDLMYGQNAGGAMGNSASPAQGSNPIPKQPFQLDPLLYSQLRLLDAQTYKNNMDGKVADIQAQNDEEYSYLERLMNLGIGQEQIHYLQSEWQKNHKLMDQIDQNILNMKEQWSIFHEQVNTQVAQTQLLIEQGKTQEAARWLYIAQKEGQELNNEQQRIVNQYLPKKLQSEIDLNYANVKNALSAAKEHEAGAVLKTEQAESEKTNREFTKANTKKVKQQTKTEIFVGEQQKIKAQYEKINQTMGVIEKGAHSLEMLTGSMENVAGAAEKSTGAVKNIIPIL